ncbi:hypothetical protein HG531_007818 [Fusarium graminearum]|nr:hypothetical protein HG531_007818 [Fusarium graminearum]
MDPCSILIRQFPHFAHLFNACQGITTRVDFAGTQRNHTGYIALLKLFLQSVKIQPPWLTVAKSQLLYGTSTEANYTGSLGQRAVACTCEDLELLDTS